MEEANTPHNRIQSMTTKAHNVLDKLEATENFLNTHQSSYSFGEIAKPRHAHERTSTQMFEQSSRKAGNEMHHLVTQGPRLQAECYQI